MAAIEDPWIIFVFCLMVMALLSLFLVFYVTPKLASQHTLRGHSGPTGGNVIVASTGPTGVQGPQGVTGRIGNTGHRGPLGQTGVTGPQGPQGMQGPLGVSGPIGPFTPENTGPTGPQGFPGSNTNTGPTGITNLITGPTGPSATGPGGPTGVQGIPAITQNTGPTGAQGMGPSSFSPYNPTLPYLAISTNFGVTTNPLVGTINWTTHQSEKVVFDPFHIFDGNTTVLFPQDGTYKITARVATQQQINSIDFNAGVNTLQFNVFGAFPASGNSTASTAIFFNDFVFSDMRFALCLLHQAIVTVVAGQTLQWSLLPVVQTPSPLIGISGFMEVEMLPPALPLPPLRRTILNGPNVPLGASNVLDWGAIGPNLRSYDPYFLFNGSTTVVAPGAANRSYTTQSWTTTRSVSTTRAFGVEILGASQISRSRANYPGFNAPGNTTVFSNVHTNRIFGGAATTNLRVQNTIADATTVTASGADMAYLEVEQLPLNPPYAICSIFYGNNLVLAQSHPIVVWNSTPPPIVYDPFGMWDGTSGITIPTPGYYRLTGRVWAFNPEIGSGETIQFILQFTNPLPSDTLESVNGLITRAIFNSQQLGPADHNVNEYYITLLALVHVTAPTKINLRFTTVRRASTATVAVNPRNGFIEVRQVGSLS